MKRRRTLGTTAFLRRSSLDAANMIVRVCRREQSGMKSPNPDFVSRISAPAKAGAEGK